MSEEVVQAQRAGKSKTIVLAAATAVVGLVIGYGIGGLAQANQGAHVAVEGAELLTKEVDAANLKVSELNDILKAAASKVKAGDFPSAEIEKLGGLEIPFDGSNIMNKGIGRYNAAAVTMLLGYATSIADVKDQTDKIRRLFGAAKAQFEEDAKEKVDPKIHWGLVIADGPQGKWARLSPLGDKAFLINDKKTKNYKWPSELEVGKTKLEMYKKGEPDGAFFPIDPSTEGAVCPQNMQARLLVALMDLGGTLAGDKTPGHEKDGVIDVGEKLMDQLRKIGGPG
jgi:hypothetical protein